MIITELDIKQRIKDLAKQIQSDYDYVDELYFIYILDGAFIFAADLARELSKLGVRLVIGSLLIKTYEGMKSVGDPIIRPSFNFSIMDKNVLIIEDILDTGNTLNIVVKAIRQQKPNSINICVLLRKNIDRKNDQEIRYVGFEVEDKFIIGYGLDLDGVYRELPYITDIEHKEYLYSDEIKYSWGTNYNIGARNGTDIEFVDTISKPPKSTDKKSLTLNELLAKCDKCPTVFTQRSDGMFGCDLRCKDLDKKEDLNKKGN